MKKSLTSYFLNKKYHFYNFPEQLTIEDYQRTEEAIVAHLKKKKEITSIYRLGTIHHPGISDLDIVYVAEKLADKNRDEYLSLKKVKGVDFRVLTHSIFSLNRFCFENINSCFHLSQITHLDGEQILCGQPPEDGRILKNVFSIIGSEASSLDFFYRLKTQDHFNVRRTLMRLYAVRYDMAGVKIFNHDGNPFWDEFNDQSFSLRENWFSLDDKKRITLMLDLCDRAVTVYQEIITSLTKFMREKGFGDTGFLSDKEYFLEGGSNRLFIFSDRLWAQKSYPFLCIPRISVPTFFTQEIAQIIERTHCYPIILPKSYILYFYFLSCFDGPFSSLLRQKMSFPHLGDVKNSQMPFREAFQRLADICNNHWDYLISNNIDVSLFIFVDFFIENDPVSSIKQRLFQGAAGKFFRRHHRRSVISKMRSL